MSEQLAAAPIALMTYRGAESVADMLAAEQVLSNAWCWTGPPVARQTSVTNFLSDADAPNIVA